MWVLVDANMEKKGTGAKPKQNQSIRGRMSFPFPKIVLRTLKKHVKC
jgi:hypothetical protein